MRRAAHSISLTSDEYQAIIDAIQHNTGIAEYAVLYSTTEYKKVRVAYLDDEFARWEIENLGSTALGWASLAPTAVGD